MGRLLVVKRNGQKLSLYAFSKDPRHKSVCYGRCARTWLPLITDGKIVVRGASIRKNHLSTFTRRDGSHQIEYFGQPLYRCYRNTKTGQVDGDSSYEFGGSWSLMGYKGSVVQPGGYGANPAPPCRKARIALSSSS